MKHKFKINVTQKHIDYGMPGFCKKCPVALALLDAGLAPEVEVGVSYIYLCSEENTPSFLAEVLTPKKVKDFMKKFDYHQKVKPFSFVLEFDDKN